MDPDGVLGRARLPLDRSDHCSSSIAVWSFSAKMTTKTFHYDYLIIWAVFDYCSFAALSRLTFTGICQQPQRIHFTGGADPRDQSPTRESQGIALRSYGAARRICCCHPAAAEGECLTYLLCDFHSVLLWLVSSEPSTLHTLANPCSLIRVTFVIHTEYLRY